MKLNQRVTIPAPLTHEGGVGERHMDNPHYKLERLAMTCLLWENTFYKDGTVIAKEMGELVPLCQPEFVAGLAIEIRKKHNLRHCPLLLLRELARCKGSGKLVAAALEQVISRADELGEFLKIYWRDKKDAPIAAGIKRGLASAFTKFNEYQLAKYDRDAEVKLRDVMFLVHPKPATPEQAGLWKKVAQRELATPDTWEVALSAGADKRETFERLLREKRLGALATIRNLRGMLEVGVSRELIVARLTEDPITGVLPYQFVTAARYAPQMEAELETAMTKSVQGMPGLPGRTGLLIDVSGSMDYPLTSQPGYRPSAHVTTRVDAAAGLAIFLREVCPAVEVATFSRQTVVIPARRGFALRDAIANSQPHGTTHLRKALTELEPHWKVLDRVIVITDEQSDDGILRAFTPKAYVVNVAPYKVGVGADQGWTKVNGWGERIVDYVRWMEGEK